MPTRPINFEPKIEKFSQDAVEQKYFPGVSSITSLVNYAIGELMKQLKEVH